MQRWLAGRLPVRTRASWPEGESYKPVGYLKQEKRIMLSRLFGGKLKRDR